MHSSMIIVFQAISVSNLNLCGIHTVDALWLPLWAFESVAIEFVAIKFSNIEFATIELATIKFAMNQSGEPHKLGTISRTDFESAPDLGVPKPATDPGVQETCATTRIQKKNQIQSRRSRRAINWRLGNEFRVDYSNFRIYF